MNNDCPEEALLVSGISLSDPVICSVFGVLELDFLSRI
jgi:hypothetical protein